MGVGSAERLSKVRWGVADEIAIAWVVTIPATAAVAGGVYWLILNAPAALAWLNNLRFR
jgi:PiT family inorganic phosphate transporter